MTNQDLKDLIDSISLEAGGDYLSGLRVTKYKLSEDALTDDVIEALHANFAHYARVYVTGNILTLEHPEQDEE